jgi:hypothetical protein
VVIKKQAIEYYGIHNYIIIKSIFSTIQPANWTQIQPNKIVKHKQPHTAGRTTTQNE